MIITIVGGGSTFTPGIVKSIALREKELELEEIRLFDIDKERQDKVAVVVNWILKEDVKTDVKLTVTNCEKEAYTDATFILHKCVLVNMKCVSRMKNSIEIWLCRSRNLWLWRDGIRTAYNTTNDKGY